MQMKKHKIYKLGSNLFCLLCTYTRDQSNMPGFFLLNRVLELIFKTLSLFLKILSFFYFKMMSMEEKLGFHEKMIKNFHLLLNDRCHPMWL